MLPASKHKGFFFGISYILEKEKKGFDNRCTYSLDLERPFLMSTFVVSATETERNIVDEALIGVTIQKKNQKDLL